MTDTSARTAVRCLRNGIVPIDEIEAISVGYDRVRDDFQRRLTQLAADGFPRALFVQGEWGTGKSHCLSYIRSMCRALGIPNVLVSLNARDRALNHPQRAYSLLIEQLELDGLRGLQSILGAKLLDSNLCDILHKLPAWDQVRGRAYPLNQPGGILHRTLKELCECLAHGRDPLSEPALWTIPLGGDLRTDGAQTRQKALDRLEELGSLFHHLGNGGLVLFFDEAETIDQLPSINSRRGAYNVLGRLIDMQYVWVVFAITKRFDQTISSDRNRVFESRGLIRPETKNAKVFFNMWTNKHLDRFTPVSIEWSDRRVKTLVGNVKSLYARAYGSGTQTSNQSLVHQWMRDPARNPRILVRLVVDDLDRARPLAGITQREQSPVEVVESVECERSVLDTFDHDVAQFDESTEWDGTTDPLESLRARANAGEAEAQFQMALLDDTRSGVPRTKALESLRWYALAAKQGHREAQFNLGVMFYRGRVVTKDDTEARRWWQQAADQGHLHAMNYLAAIYMRGCGVQQNDVEAFKWRAIVRSRAILEEVSDGADEYWRKMSPHAIEQGDTELSRRMTLAQINEALGVARAWEAAHPREP